MNKLLFAGAFSLLLCACQSDFSHNTTSTWKAIESANIEKTVDRVEQSNIDSHRSFSIQKGERKSLKQYGTVSTKSKNKSKPYSTKKRYRSLSSCDCGYGYCYGPRGGRYCYTSGGNKSYR